MRPAIPTTNHCNDIQKYLGAGLAGPHVNDQRVRVEGPPAVLREAWFVVEHPTYGAHTWSTHVEHTCGTHTHTHRHTDTQTHRHTHTSTNTHRAHCSQTSQAGRLSGKEETRLDEIQHEASKKYLSTPQTHPLSIYPTKRQTRQTYPSRHERRHRWRLGRRRPPQPSDQVTPCESWYAGASGAWHSAF